MTGCFLETKHLSKTFRTKASLMRKAAEVKAVSNVNLSVPQNRSLALVGESGCGKSTLARLLLRLLEASSGEVYFKGKNLSRLSSSELRPMRRHIQMIHQNPSTALDPRLTVHEAIAEGLIVQGMTPAEGLQEHIASILLEIGLPADFAHRYPHELSGGQKQRVCIARSLALSPELLVLDEPTSALDVSVQAQILEVLDTLKKRRNLTYIFITHDLAVVRQVCDFVVVMYLGRVVEEGPVEEVFQNPRHPYTQTLLSAVPRLRNSTVPALDMPGDPPNPASVPSGCAFHPRCKHAKGICETGDVPRLTALSNDHKSACRFASELLQLERETTITSTGT